MFYPIFIGGVRVDVHLIDQKDVDEGEREAGQLGRVEVYASQRFKNQDLIQALRTERDLLQLAFFGEKSLKGCEAKGPLAPQKSATSSSREHWRFDVVEEILKEIERHPKIQWI